MVSPKPDGSEDTKLCSFSFLKEKEPKRTLLQTSLTGRLCLFFLSEKTDTVNPIIVNEAYLLPDFFYKSSVEKYRCGIDSKWFPSGYLWFFLQNWTNKYSPKTALSVVKKWNLKSGAEHRNRTRNGRPPTYIFLYHWYIAI